MIRRLIPALALLWAPGAALALSIPPVPTGGPPFEIPPVIEHLPPDETPPELTLPGKPAGPPFEVPVGKPDFLSSSLASSSVASLDYDSDYHGVYGPPFGSPFGFTALIGPPPNVPPGPPLGLPPTPNTPALGQFPLAGFVPPGRIQAVPEPTSVWLLGAGGMAGLAWWGRRRPR